MFTMFAFDPDIMIKIAKLHSSASTYIANNIAIIKLSTEQNF